MTLAERVRLARESRDPSPLVEAIPYSRFMGITMEIDGEAVIGKLAASEHLIGNARMGHLHGGAIGALLESTAIFQLLWSAEAVTVPKTINITLQYLRSSKQLDTFARADLTRLGRRVANVHAVAWQDDPDRPTAAATAHFLLPGAA